MTDKDRQDRLVRILNGALDLPYSRRNTFVAEASDGNRELMEEIADLLSRVGEVNEFLDDARQVVHGLPPGPTAAEGASGGAAPDACPLGATSATVGDGVPAIAAPTRIGPYTILGVLGEGGMGVVYLAEQEEPVRRRVALKVVKLGMHTKEVVARFEVELQALAMMEHPNIARVHDAGATDDGRPYFVMEYVRGLRLDEYCDLHKMTVRQRLELFSQVCQGVDHAHRRGIIHRDLKPSNVLVSTPDEAPMVKIIDFGVARATNQRLTEKTIYTEIGRAVGTPAYMSPEQADLTGKDVDHRTDIYSLGVLLYEVLVGEPPLDPELLAKAAFDEILRRIRDEDPPTPSTRWTRMNMETVTRVAARRSSSPNELVGMLRGDLDWITMKAVAKERERRYATVAELAADITRHLVGDPVEAGPPSVVYKLKKYVGKNRIPVAAASAVFLALAVGFVVSFFFVRAARESAEVAVKNERLANQRAAENLVFADIELLRTYDTEESKAIWPWPPKKRAAAESWLEKAEGLLARIDDYRAELARIRRTGLSGESESPGGGVRTYRFSDAETTQHHEMIETLVRDLESFADPDPTRGTVAMIRRRLEICPSEAVAGEAWREAIASIRSRQVCPMYNGLELEVVEDLFPLGRDPRSKLWEFIHPRTGSVPERDDSGRLQITGDCGLILVLLPGGLFTMGSPEEEMDRESQELQHRVRLSPFLIAKHEVTQAQWKAVMGTDPSAFKGDALPVERVGWKKCKQFSTKIGLTLPTAAQWEYACRAGTSTPFSFGMTVTLEEVNYNRVEPGDRGSSLEPSRQKTVAVGSLPANRFGLHEMHGNVFEWCKDCFDEGFYSKSEASGVDPVCSTSSGRGEGRAIRGGSWRDYASDCRSAFRGMHRLGRRSRTLGFRPSMSIR